MKNQHLAISLFSNCGAGDIGFRDAGFDFKIMAELVAKRMEVCLLNHTGATGIHGDLRETYRNVIDTFKAMYPGRELSLLSACPPCQGMSSAKGKRGSGQDPDEGSKDKRNLLAEVIGLVALGLMPKIIVVENVPQFFTKLVRHPKTNDPLSAANLLAEMLGESYSFYPIITDLADYGVPQTRKRSFITFIRKDLTITTRLAEIEQYPYPKPSHGTNGIKHKSVVEALKELKAPTLDPSTDEGSRANEYNELHFVPVWKDRRFTMVKAIPPYSGKSAWENNTCQSCGNYTNHIEDSVYCFQCGDILPKPIVFISDKEVRLIKGFKTSYKRMSPNGPSPTILTASAHLGSHNTIHPHENRVLSVLECAHLQTFPRNFVWGKALKKWGHSSVRAMIGEAVPPLFTLKHGRVLMDLLTGNYNEILLPSIDKRAKNARKKLRNSL